MSKESKAQQEARIKREWKIARRSTAKIERDQNIKIWKHIILDGFKTVRQLIGLLIIGTGITVALFALVGIIAWGIYSIAT